MQDPKALAAALIGTKNLPAGLAHIRERAGEAHAYYRLEPYPLYHFRDWKTEDRGPLPRCLPLTKSIVDRSARWLFGKPLRIEVPENPDLETFIRQVWTSNNLQTRMKARAVRGALDGGIALKFSYDQANQERPVCVQTLSITQEVRFYYHPHDRAQLLMARIQYPFQDAEGKTFWYREDWTAETLAIYKPVSLDQLQKSDPDRFEGWEIEKQERNPFGLIPVVHVRNLDVDDTWGVGDLWDLYRVIDRINLTFHLMDRSNQFDSTLNPVFIDADLEEDDIEKPAQPGEGIAINSAEGGDSQRQAKVVYPPSGNSLRPAMMEYAKELARQVLAGASSTELDQDQITNKGNLTAAVLELIYQDQIAITNDKRDTYGEHGLCEFFKIMARGLANAGCREFTVTDKPESVKAELRWPSYFELSDQERESRTNRLGNQVDRGFLPHERAIEEVSQMEGRHDVKAVKDELDKHGVTAEASAAQKRKFQPEPAPVVGGQPQGKK